MSKRLMIKNTIKKVECKTWYCDVTGLTPDRIEYLMQENHKVVCDVKVKPELVLIGEEGQDNDLET